MSDEKLAEIRRVVNTWSKSSNKYWDIIGILDGLGKSANDRSDEIPATASSHTLPCPRD